MQLNTTLLEVSLKVNSEVEKRNEVGNNIKGKS
jgi:hypothetical protein